MYMYGWRHEKGGWFFSPEISAHVCPGYKTKPGWARRGRLGEANRTHHLWTYLVSLLPPSVSSSHVLLPLKCVLHKHIPEEAGPWNWALTLFYYYQCMNSAWSQWRLKKIYLTTCICQRRMFILCIYCSMYLIVFEK